MNHIVITAFCFGGVFIGQLDLLNAEANAMKAFESKDVETRRAAVGYVQFMYRGADTGPGKKWIAVLLKALKDPDAEVRQRVAGVFSVFGEASKPAVPLLASLLRNDKEIKVRITAAHTLLSLELVSREALPALMEARNDSNKFVRIYCGTAIVALGKEDVRALYFLLDLSKDEDVHVSEEALDAFSYIGVSAIPILNDGLKDKSPLVRRWTIRAFRALMSKDSERAKFPPDVIPLLVNAINDENKEVAMSAISAVAQLGYAAKEAIPAIVKRFNGADWQLRCYAIYHVPRFGIAAESAIPALTAALDDENERVRSAARDALDRIQEAKNAGKRRV